MINFGFGDVIQKLEEYFGHRITRAFLALIGIALADWIIGVAVRQSVYPLIAWLTGAGPTAEAAHTGINWIVTVVWVVAVGMMVVSLYRSREGLAYYFRNKSRIEAVASELEAGLSDLQARTERLTAIEAEIEQKRTEASAVLEQAKALALDMERTKSGQSH